MTNETSTRGVAGGAHMNGAVAGAPGVALGPHLMYGAAPGAATGSARGALTMARAPGIACQFPTGTAFHQG